MGELPPPDKPPIRWGDIGRHARDSLPVFLVLTAIDVWGFLVVVRKTRIWGIEPWVWLAVGVGALLLYCYWLAIRISMLSDPSRRREVSERVAALRACPFSVNGKDYSGFELTLAFSHKLLEGLWQSHFPRLIGEHVGMTMAGDNYLALKATADALLGLWRREGLLEEWHRAEETGRVHDRKFLPDKRLGFLVLREIGRQADLAASARKN